MLTILWSLINVVLFIYFMKILIYSFKEANKNLNLISSLILFLGLFHFFKFKENDKPKYFKYSNIEINNNYEIFPIKLFKLEENSPFETILLSINCYKIANKTTVISAQSIDGSFAIGKNLIAEKINLKEKGLNIYEFEIFGRIEWSLLGGSIYNQNKKIKKIVKV